MKTSNVPRRPVVLIILDGFGTNPARVNNAVVEAPTPNLDRYFSHHPHTLLQASGHAVGLPDGQMGNSEVGHLTIGCGHIVRQDLVYIDDCIADESFFNNPAFLDAISNAKQNQRPLHLLGLVSDGGVHSHMTHLLALIELCKRHRVKPALHMITDGRDTPPRSALSYLPPLESALKEAGGEIATVSGRYYTMDRDNRWDRTERAWQALVNGGKSAANAREAIEASYAEDKGDEFILPTAIKNGARIQSGDQVMFFNFRKDRTRQITEALSQQDFDKFARESFTPVTVTCMTEYDKKYRQPYAFEQDRPHTTLAEVISTAELKQFHCAETEKYPHVTYFLNGGRNEPFPGEDRVIVPSPKVATYDLQPEMSAPEVADAVIKAIESAEYAFVVVNFANGDMVGHSGLRAAILQCVQAMDREVGRVIDSAVEHGYSVLLSADHGNCEEYVDPVTGEPHTQHTVYPVPCLVIDEANWQLSIGAGLSSIAPTVLQLMGLPVPKAMNGRSLLLKAQQSA